MERKKHVPRYAGWSSHLTSLSSKIYLLTELFKYRESAAPMADGGLRSSSPRFTGSVPGSSGKIDLALGAGGAKLKKTGAGSGEFAQVGEGSLKRFQMVGLEGDRTGVSVQEIEALVCVNVLQPSLAIVLTFQRCFGSSSRGFSSLKRPPLFGPATQFFLASKSPAIR